MASITYTPGSGSQLGSGASGMAWVPPPATGPQVTTANPYFPDPVHFYGQETAELGAVIRDNTAALNAGQLFTCTSGLNVGDAVRFTGPRTVGLAYSADAGTAAVVGFVSHKPSSTTCFIKQTFYFSAASGFSGFSGVTGSPAGASGYGSPVYLNSGTSSYSGAPGTYQKEVGISLSPREAILQADPLTAKQAPLSGFRNKIINGAMNIYQRGSVAVSGFALDRWYYENVTGSVATCSQSTDVPTFSQSGENYQYSLKLDFSTGDTSVTGGEACDVIYRVEGYDWQACHQKWVTCSFWVKSTITGIYTFAVSNSANDRNYVTEYIVHTTNTWEKKVIKIPPCDAGGTWLFTNGVGANLRWFIASGSNYHATTNNVWNSTSLKIASANQCNGVSSASNDFLLTGVQVEVGTEPTSFEWRHFGTELELCQRYCWRPTYGTSYYATISAQKVTSNSILVDMPTPTTMRTAPTLSVLSSPSWVTTFPATNDQICTYDYNAVGYLTITGALTFSLNSSGPDNQVLQMIAGTSFAAGGGVGAALQVQIGGGAVICWGAEF